MKEVLEVAYKSSDRYKKFINGFTPQIKEWMSDNDVLRVDIEGKKVFCYQHKTHSDYSIFIHGWLEGYITSEALTEFLKDRYFWVEYSLKQFLEMIQND